MSTIATTPATPTQTTGRLWCWLGLTVAFLGIGVYMVQLLVLKQLGTTPWYAPLLATLGVTLVLLSLRKRRTVFRFLALMLVVLLAGYEWFWMFSFTKQVRYAGPSAGEKLPPFQATLASSGQPFTNADLANGTPTAMVFFRGRW